jgi:type I restriction enzyme R subunit
LTKLVESVLEEAALLWLAEAGFTVAHGPDIAFGQAGAERSDPTYRDVVLDWRLREALVRLNSNLPQEALDDAFRKIVRADGPSLIERNRAVHRMLVDGVTVEYRRADGSIAGAQARVIDFDDPGNNDWLAVNQFTVVGPQGHNRRADIVMFVNGLPLGVIELKNPADENATIWSALNQLQTYQSQIPALFDYNCALVVSDGTEARIGVLGAGKEWFKPWRTIDGRGDAPKGMPELQVVLEGVFDKRRFLDLIRYFIVFEDMGGGVLTKKMAGYHQFHAVNFAVEQTLRAAAAPELARAAEERARYRSDRPQGGVPGDRRVGVVWHTQGSGKSLTMVFYSGRLILDPLMENPTIVVLTDRNDLDDQLFGTFARCRDLLRQDPVQVVDRADLREKLRVAGGGVVFTTIQKFLPEEKGDRNAVLSNRRNIVVIADEAHRSQYGFEAKLDPKTGKTTYGLALSVRDSLPQASFIGFTGTPVELDDRDTRAIFGNYIDVYDIHRAVEDGATVPIYYEGRLAKLELSEAERPKIDPDFEEVTEGEEVERKEGLKSKWAQLAAVVGSEKRLRLVAVDLVDHFEKRLEVMDGKAMVVCMSRRICVELYREIVALRPEWAGEGDDAGAIKVVMTGNATDPLEFQPHVRNKSRREALARRFRDPADPFRIVIVRDMWLTGFDAPSLHTMYIDKPMHGHGLMQAIARVNRVFKDKPGGLVVDYLGLANELREALVAYTESGGKGKPTFNQQDAIHAMQREYEVCLGLFDGFDWSPFCSGSAAERVSVLPKAQEHILGLRDHQGHPNGKERLLDAVGSLSKAFALAVPSDEAMSILQDVAFFQAVRSVLVKGTVRGPHDREDLDHAIRQIVSRAVASDEIIDIFAAAGLKKPDISILSDDFLNEVKEMPERNLAVELLAKLLKGEIKSRSRRNVVEARSFEKMLDEAVRRYQNRAIETAQVIEALIALAKDMRAADARGEALCLTEDELAFYDALGVNDSAVAVLGDETLRDIARELVATVKANVTIDWTVRENVQAHLRVLVKRCLRKHGYPPDKQAKATITVLEQAEVLSEHWAAA